MRRFLSRRTRLFAASVAALAILFNALWPLVASAEPRRGDVLLEVCSAVGYKAITVAPNTPASPAETSHMAAHCPFCIGFCGSPALLPTPSVPSFEVASISYARPASRAALAPTPSAHLFARPRAPPVSV